MAILSSKPKTATASGALATLAGGLNPAAAAPAPAVPMTPEATIMNAAAKTGEIGQQWLDFSKSQWAINDTRLAELDATYKSMSADQLKLAQDQFNYTKTTTDKQLADSQTMLNDARGVTAQQKGIADQQFGYAAEDRDRYNTVFKPVEDKFVEEASNYSSPERLAQVAAEAKADVLTSASQAKETAARQAASMGLNPNSGRMAGITRAGDLGTALASAGAQNNARTAAIDKGIGLKADVVNLGQGTLARSQTGTQLGLSAGNAALSGNIAATGLATQIGNSAISNNNAAAGLAIGTRDSILAGSRANTALRNDNAALAGAGYSGAMSGYSNAGGAMQSMYNTQKGVEQNTETNKSNNFNGVMSAIGTGLGFFLSDEDAKENKEAIPEGAALEAVNSMPVEEWDYKEGMADEGHHVGTYAQDFQRATGKGSGKTIPAQDAIGITMKAVQDLSVQVDKISQAVGLTRTKPKKTVGAQPLEQAA